MLDRLIRKAFPLKNSYDDDTWGVFGCLILSFVVFGILRLLKSSLVCCNAKASVVYDTCWKGIECLPFNIVYTYVLVGITFTIIIILIHMVKEYFSKKSKVTKSYKREDALKLTGLLFIILGALYLEGLIQLAKAFNNNKIEFIIVIAAIYVLGELWFWTDKEKPKEEENKMSFTFNRKANGILSSMPLVVAIYAIVTRRNEVMDILIDTYRIIVGISNKVYIIASSLASAVWYPVLICIVVIVIVYIMVYINSKKFDRKS